MIDPHIDLEALHEGAQDIYKRGDYEELDIRGDKYAFSYAYLGLDAAFKQGHDARLALDDFLAANEKMLSDEGKEKGWSKQNPDKEQRKDVPRILTSSGARRFALDSSVTESARIVLWAGLLTFYPSLTLEYAQKLFSGSEIALMNGVLSHIMTAMTRMLTGVYDEEERAEGKEDGRGRKDGNGKPTPSTSPSSEASPSLTQETVDA